MAHELLGDRFGRMNNEPELVRNKAIFAKEASMLIAISERTKQDMVNIYQIDPQKIRVVHHGNPYSQLNASLVSSESELEFPYLLFVGHRWAYKNFDRFLVAVASLLKKYDIHLLCAGSTPFSSDEISLITKLGVSDLIHHQPITNESLPNLYRHASAFIFPSILEGFGFPILEAFACECPCILSDNSCFPEIAGNDAALYFDPESVESIAIAVEKMITASSSQRSRLIANGLSRLKVFSWSNTVKQTLDVYKHLVQGGF
nr:hypothetical protein A6C57_20735 [Fibrella sp. ES10-3-2-2]